MPVNISAYNSFTSGTNWSPAVLAAVDANKATGMELIIDTPIQLESEINFGVAGHTTYNPWVLRGDGKSAITLVNNSRKINSGGANPLHSIFKDLLIVGNTESDPGQPGYMTCHYGLRGGDHTIIDSCRFMGVAAVDRIVEADSCFLTIRNSSFSGCGSANGNVGAINARGVELDTVMFIDYQNFRGNYYNKQLYPSTWVRFTRDDVNPWNSNSYIHLKKCFSDEGTNFCYIENYPRVSIEDCASNSAGNVGIGIHLKGVKNATIRRYSIGYNPNATASIQLENCGDVLIDGLITWNGVKPIIVDANTRLTVINSPGAVVIGNTGSKYELNGVKYSVEAGGSVVQIG